MTKSEVMRIKPSGSVGVGTTDPQDRLEVAGGNIRVTGGSFIDDGTTLDVPDYVFEAGYSLMPPADLAVYIAREKRLPDMPGAADVKKRGLNVSEFQMSLLRKIEELTLYVLEQQKTLETQQTQMRVQQARIEALEEAKARKR